MKKLIILFLLLPIFCSAQYDSTKNLQSIDAYGYSWKNAAFRFSIRLPKDTTKLAVKDSGCLAVKSTSLFLWNGYKWVLAGGSSASSSFIGVDSVVVKSSGCVDTFYQWKQGVRTIITTVDEQNGINSGGAVTVGANDTTFNVAAAVYKIGCVRYSSNAASLVLNGNSDSAKGRIDVIGVNSSGAVFAIQGQNLTNPIAPSLSATQLGLATVYFPPLKDSGITNIYNNVNVNGIDSSAYISVATTPDSLCFIFTSRRRSDTICTTRGSGGGIDSLRRIGINVSALKNGVWTNQFTDSVGSGGGGGVDSLRLAYANGSSIDTVQALKSGIWRPQFTLNAHVDATANNKFARTYSGVIRATVPAGASQPITWTILDSASVHQPFGLDSVKGLGNAIQIFYAKVKNVSSLIIAPDETLASAGVFVGATVGDSVSNAFAYISTQNTGSLTGNGSTWSNSGISLTGLSYTPSTGLTTFTPTTSFGTIYSGSPELEGMIIQSVGDTMRYIRRVYSGLGANTVGFRMLDSIGRTDTGQLSASHKLAVIVPRTRTASIPAQTSTSQGFPGDLYTAAANYWIIAQMDVYMIASATSSTTATIEWQTADIPTNQYATNYRITRATAAAPGVETTIFNGFGFSYLDTGLTANTRYIYRMYATLPTVGERLITNEKIKTD
jgi:hypothetical protein